MKKIKAKRILKTYEIKECEGVLFEHGGHSYCICYVEEDSCYYAIEITTGMSVAKYGIYDYVDEGFDFTSELASDKLKNRIMEIPQDIIDRGIIKAKAIIALANITYPINIR